MLYSARDFAVSMAASACALLRVRNAASRASHGITRHGSCPHHCAVGEERIAFQRYALSNCATPASHGCKTRWRAQCRSARKRKRADTFVAARLSCTRPAIGARPPQADRANLSARKYRARCVGARRTNGDRRRAKLSRVQCLITAVPSSAGVAAGTFAVSAFSIFASSSITFGTHSSACSSTCSIQRTG